MLPVTDYHNLTLHYQLSQPDSAIFTGSVQLHLYLQLKVFKHGSHQKLITMLGDFGPPLVN